jgi:hypothetical protein
MGRMMQCAFGFIELRRSCGVSTVIFDKYYMPIVKFSQNRE